MLTKLLFTALIIAASVLYLRHRSSARRPAPSLQPPPASARYWRALPAVLLLTMLGVSALVFWLQWREAHRIFTLRVVDTRTGKETVYPVYPDAVQGRSFRTVDGRVVTLADVERMELTEVEP